MSPSPLTLAERDMLCPALSCYLSLHGSKGFGRMDAEATVTGKPVIGTG